MPFRVLMFTSLAMLAFAANSLLNRVALSETDIDPASFTLIRLVSGAVLLWLLHRLKTPVHTRTVSVAGSWISAFSLFVYAAGFSFAYLSLTAATGALLLFAAVQITMMAVAVWRGERMTFWQLTGFMLALAGLSVLLLPGVSAPSWQGALLMMTAGGAWGIYTLRGQGTTDPLHVTAGNFLRAVPMAVVCCLLVGRTHFDSLGVMYAILSGGVASGLGYAIWYSVLPFLPAMSAATVQLSVPVLAALGGVIFLSESVSIRLFIASVAILGGIAVVLWGKTAPQPE
ncbi:membrane protein [Photobacterium galatheae]|uniref:Membrane protein n=1 Tax=Photobacterium galatheae TaxID=1654360 RepID=A0A066RQ63_9GAMM|nr:membrane protein [Photobacterium galatheae]